jgi:very-short-patch-repair endonuclease
MRKPVTRDMSRRLRRDPQGAKRILWRHLRANALGVRFRRQHPIPPYIADFAAPTIRLVIEVDGGQHGGGADGARAATMIASGRRIMRAWDKELYDNLEGCLQRIAEAVRPLTHARRQVVPPGPSSSRIP